MKPKFKSMAWARLLIVLVAAIPCKRRKKHQQRTNSTERNTTAQNGALHRGFNCASSQTSKTPVVCSPPNSTTFVKTIPITTEPQRVNKDDRYGTKYTSGNSFRLKNVPSSRVTFEDLFIKTSQRIVSVCTKNKANLPSPSWTNNHTLQPPTPCPINQPFRQQQSRKIT